MKTFDFTCDARVTLTVRAETQDDAKKQWDTFCNQMAVAGDWKRCRMTANVPRELFYVYLLDGEPDVDEDEVDHTDT
jgi:hypothetical protein